jgi:sporulation protein YlmC with PRC-barrel domain
MNPARSIKLMSEVRDLQILDRDGVKCGVVDDIAFSGGPGRPLKIAALLVGPGAWRGRLPGWAFALVKALAGEEVVSVPWSQVQTVTSMVKLKRTAAELGLAAAEERARRRLPRLPAW